MKPTWFPRQPVRAILIACAASPSRGFAIGICERRVDNTVWQETPVIVGNFNDAWQLAHVRSRETGLPIVDTVSPRPRGPGEGERTAA